MPLPQHHTVQRLRTPQPRLPCPPSVGTLPAVPGPFVIGALSTKYGSFDAPQWFVAGCIAAAGALVAAFPMRWAAADDRGTAAARRAASLELRQLSRRASQSATAARATGEAMA
jgi:hypothetical protein